MPCSTNPAGPRCNNYNTILVYASESANADQIAMLLTPPD